MRWLKYVVILIVTVFFAALVVAIATDIPTAEADYGNPWGHRAGGRFEYIQYDDAMEILTDTKTGQEYLVWYWRDDVEIQPLGTVAEQ